MKTHAIKLFFGLQSIIIAFCLCRLRADESKKLVDVRDILRNSDAVLFQNGITKKVGEQFDSGGRGKWMFTVYYYKNRENNNYSYHEYSLQNERKTSSSIKIERPDGVWSLYSGVAIRQPDGQRDAVITIYLDSKPVLGTVTDCFENGEPCMRVDITPSLDGQQNPPPGYQEPNIYRYEFLISKNSGVIILRRSYSKQGKILLQEKITSVEKNYDFPISNFEIPKNYRILFPDNQSEYGALLLKYGRSANNNKTNQQQNTMKKTGKQRPANTNKQQ